MIIVLDPLIRIKYRFRWLNGSGSGWDYGSGFWMRMFEKFSVGLEASPEVRLFFEGF